MKPAIKIMRDWLLTCPLFEADGGTLLRINYLGADPMQFAIEDSPSDPILERYINGSKRAKNYALVSRLDYSEEQISAAASSGFFDDLCAWIEAQNDLRQFPPMDAGRTIEGVAINTSGYIIQVSSSTCKFQLELQLQYFQPKGVELNESI